MRRLSTLILFLMLASDAQAGLRTHGLTIDLLPGSSPLEGATYDGVFRVSSRGATSFALSAIDSDDDGWTQLSLDTIGYTLAAGESIDLPFQLTCLDLSTGFYLEYVVDDQVFRRDFIPVSRALRNAVEAPPGIFVPGKQESSEASPDPLPRPDVAGRDRLGTTTEGLDDTGEDTAGLAKGVVTVHGRIVYQRWGQEWTGADGVTVHLWDEDSGADDYLGGTSTDEQGRFSVTFFTGENPDIYAEFLAGNTKVEVQEPSFFEPIYSWITPTFANQASSGTVNLPDFTAHDWTGRRVMHQITSVTRAWRWLYGLGYGHIDDVDILFPDSDWPHYESFEEEIHLPSTWGWNDGTMWHEYGHHFIDDFGDSDGGEYCNAGDRCDSDDDCKHCTWCKENEGVAWSEGIAQFFADRITVYVDDTYGWMDGDAINGRTFETNDKCWSGSGGNNAYDDPSKTEGALAGLMRDLADGDGDSDPRGGGRSFDYLQLGSKSVLDVAAIDDPITPWQFINAFRARHPSFGNGIWNAAWNNGYNFDVTPPGTVSSLTSTSHITSGDSPDGTIDFQWTTPSDDLSGVWGYSLYIANTPTFPDASVDLDSTAPVGNTQAYTTGELGPGTYYFSVRTVDNAGNWSGSYISFGPITVRDPYPADLVAVHHPSFFDAPLVPSNSSAMPSGRGIAPNTLGPVTPTYLNLQLFNSGEQATPPGLIEITPTVDGVLATVLSISSANPLGGMGYLAWNNIGPLQVPGGRHTIGYWADSGEDLAEANEFDNRHVGQWVWSLPGVASGFTLGRGTPPWVHAGGGIENNSDGISIAVETGFGGVVMWPDNEADNYDLVLHSASNGSQQGFELATKKVDSQRAVGCLDGVLYNGFGIRVNKLDVATERWDSERTATYGGYQIQTLISTPIPFNASQTSSWAQDERVTVLHFDLLPADVGEVEVILQADPAVGRMWLRVMDGENDWFNLHNQPKADDTDANGLATKLVVLDEGKHGIVVWRDPKDQPDPERPASATSWDVLVRPARPDPATVTPPGWVETFVPSPLPNGQDIQVVIPDDLYGNGSTWLNVTMANLRANPVLQVPMEEYLDGELLMSRTASLLGHAQFSLNNLGPFTIRGGRHSLTHRLDPLDIKDENDETNNVAGGQWVWTGLPMSVGSTITRAVPPDLTGGWADVSVFGTLFFNSDGLTTPIPSPAGEDGRWHGLAVVPGSSSDVDLRLHKQDASLYGMYGGFAEVEVASSAGVGLVDFVLVNHRFRQPRQYDAGVIRMEGNEDYTATLVESTWLGDQPSGTLGPFALVSGEVLQLREMTLSAGRHVIEIGNLSGNADLGVSLHAPEQYLAARDLGVPRGIAWVEEAGADESLMVDLAAEGKYCLAVWKVGSADKDLTATYQITIDDGVTGADSTPASNRRDRIVGIHPNPFNPRTTISFELADRTFVSMGIYDLRGRLVRELVAKEWDAGRHEVVWDGIDAAGRIVSSGAYLAKLEGSGIRSIRKLTLLK